MPTGSAISVYKPAVQSLVGESPIIERLDMFQLNTLYLAEEGTLIGI